MARFVGEPPSVEDRSHFELIKHGHQDLVQAVAFNAYGDRCATGSVDGRVRVFNRHRDGSWRLCDGWTAHAGDVLELQWLPPTVYPNVVASLGADGRFKLWAEDPSAVAGRRFSAAVTGGGAPASSRAAGRDGNPKAVFETSSNSGAPFRSFSMRHDEETRHTYLAFLAADGTLSVFENDVVEDLSHYNFLDEWNVFDVGSEAAGGGGPGGGGGGLGVAGGNSGGGGGGAAAAAASQSSGGGSGGGGATGAGGGARGRKNRGRPARGEETSFKVRFDPNPDVCYTALRAGVPTDALGLVVAAMDGVQVYRTRDTLTSTLGMSAPTKEFYLAAELRGHGGLVREVAWAPGNIRGYDLVATACQDGFVRVFQLETPLDDEDQEENDGGDHKKRGWSTAGLRTHPKRSASAAEGHERRPDGHASSQTQSYTSSQQQQQQQQQQAQPQRQSALRAGLDHSHAEHELQRRGGGGQRRPGEARHVARELCRLSSHRTPVWRVGFDDDGQILGSVGDDGKLMCYRQTPDGTWAKSSELGMMKMKMAVA